jgi:protein-L-isoaspartate(D-aspartate) O-methyltransferase
MLAPEHLHARLVDWLVEAGTLRRAAVTEAFRSVPRHLFVPEVAPADAYADAAIPTKRDSAGRPLSSASQPSIVAAMLEQLDPRPGERVLEIGAGTGYNAALLAHVVGDAGSVTTVELDQDVAEGARRHLTSAGCDAVGVVCADGAAGWPAGAPYDRIILTAGARDLAPAWVGQLAGDGRLVLPLSLRGVQVAVAFEHVGDYLASTSIVSCGFVPLRGAAAGPELTYSLGDEPGLFVSLGIERAVDPEALYVALHEPGHAVPSGIRATPGEVLGGLGLWLALHDTEAGELVAVEAAARRGVVPPVIVFPGTTVTRGLVGTSGLALLDRAGGDTGELAVRPFGRVEQELVERLIAHLHGWDARGRPSTDDLRIRAYRSAADTPDDGALALDLPHARLLLDWPST